jgi:hypothetical protein
VSCDALIIDPIKRTDITNRRPPGFPDLPLCRSHTLHPSFFLILLVVRDQQSRAVHGVVLVPFHEAREGRRRARWPVSSTQVAHGSRARVLATPPSSSARCASSAPSSSLASAAARRRARTGPRASGRCMTTQLVPGCRKLPFPALLAEVSDYIARCRCSIYKIELIWCHTHTF